MATETLKRINVTFPVSLLDELRRYVPRRERSKFIVEATEKELKQRRLLRALRDSVCVFFSILYQPCQVTPQRLQRVVSPANLEIVLDGLLAQPSVGE